MVLRLQERDLQMLKVINDCRVLYMRHLQSLFFGSPSPCYGRLKQLYEAGFVERHFLTSVTKAPSASTTLYTITKLGAQVLADAFDYTSEQFHFASKTLLNPEKLPHTMAINDFRIAVLKAAKESDFLVIDWLDELTFRSSPDYVFVKEGGKRGRKKPVLPDGYLVLKTPQGMARFFVEVDRGTEGLPQFRSQIDIYTEYMVSGKYQQRFKSKSLRILVVTTTSARRLNSLKKTVEKAGGGDRYSFCCFRPPYPPNILTDPVWQTLADPVPRALIAPAADDIYNP